LFAEKSFEISMFSRKFLIELLEFYAESLLPTEDDQKHQYELWEQILINASTHLKTKYSSLKGSISVSELEQVIAQCTEEEVLFVLDSFF